MIDELKVIRESQIRMEADVKHHIKRTDLLEESMWNRNTVVDKEIRKLELDIVSLSQPMSFMEVLKIAGTVAALVASVLAILKHYKAL